MIDRGLHAGMPKLYTVPCKGIGLFGNYGLCLFFIHESAKDARRYQMTIGISQRPKWFVHKTIPNSFRVRYNEMRHNITNIACLRHAYAAVLYQCQI